MKEIAVKLEIATKTVECHLVNLRGKVGVTSTMILVLSGVKAGVIPLCHLPDNPWNVYVSNG